MKRYIFERKKTYQFDFYAFEYNELESGLMYARKAYTSI